MSVVTLNSKYQLIDPERNCGTERSGGRDKNSPLSIISTTSNSCPFPKREELVGIAKGADTEGIS